MQCKNERKSGNLTKKLTSWQIPPLKESEFCPLISNPQFFYSLEYHPRNIKWQELNLILFNPVQRLNHSFGGLSGKPSIVMRTLADLCLIAKIVSIQSLSTFRTENFIFVNDVSTIVTMVDLLFFFFFAVWQNSFHKRLKIKNLYYNCLSNIKSIIVGLTLFYIPRMMFQNFLSEVSLINVHVNLGGADVLVTQHGLDGT